MQIGLLGCQVSIFLPDYTVSHHTRVIFRVVAVTAIIIIIIIIIMHGQLPRNLDEKLVNIEQ